MGASVNRRMIAAAIERRSVLCQRALVGLTPQLLAIVAALMLARMLGSMADTLFVKIQAHEFAAWLGHLFVGFAILMLQAIPVLVGIIVTGNLGPQRGWRRVAAIAVAVMAFTLVGLLVRIAVSIALGLDVGWRDNPLRLVADIWPRYSLLAGMLTVAWEFYRHQVASTEAMQRAELERAALEREMAEARLQAMQAQIEPHFLFNTLANVRRLYEKNQHAGKAMLESLMRYLEVALPKMRADQSTLGRDAELIEAFLRIQQIRMGERLAFAVDIPNSLRAHPVPPMMLLTLVENAIKHGVNPALLGGLVRVAARIEGDSLVMSVADTGVGFAPGSGAGTGLANVRARLAAQFGERASLALENNDLGGVTATLTLPLARAA